MAKAFAEIAPRRSPVRARLAPYRERPANAAFLVSTPESDERRGQVLVKELVSGKQAYDRSHRTQEVAGSSPASSIRPLQNLQRSPCRSGMALVRSLAT